VPDVPTNNPEQFYQGAPLLLVPDVSATADFYRRILGSRPIRGLTRPSTVSYGAIMQPFI